MDSKYILKIFVVFLLILSLVVFIKSIGISLDEIERPKKLIKTITIEGLDNNILIDTSKAFCDTHSGSDLEKSCNKLTKYNCGLTSCCVWTSDNKCKAGDISGPLFNSDSNGKTMSLEYYYYKNKCYGDKCPK